MPSELESRRPKLNPVRVPMGERDPKARVQDFSEVSLGYLEEQAMAEAERCIKCPTEPCRSGCPVSVPIKEFIIKIQEGDFEGAAKKIKETNNLPAICGRVCPQEDQCQKKCVVGKKGQAVAIGALERFASDWEIKHGEPISSVSSGLGNGIKVAVIGAGPAGLTASADLARAGYSVTLFEALHCAGGVLCYGIPKFRLPQDIVNREVDYVRSLGVDIQLNKVIGKIYGVQELFDLGYEAVFIGTGAGLPQFMNIPGENLNGVYSANEFLTRNNLMKAYDFPNLTHR